MIMLRPSEMHFNKVGNIFIAAWCVGVAALSAWGVHMYLDRVIPYEYDVATSKIEPDPIEQYADKPDDMMGVVWGLKKINRICPGKVQRFFRDMKTGKIIWTLDTTPLSQSIKIGDKELPRSFQIPPRLPPRVGYSARVCWVCNPLQNLTMFELCDMTPEIEFSVVQHPSRKEIQ